MRKTTAPGPLGLRVPAAKPDFHFVLGPPARRVALKTSRLLGVQGGLHIVVRLPGAHGERGPVTGTRPLQGVKEGGA